MIEVMDSINNHFIMSIESGRYEITTNSIKGSFVKTYLDGMYIIIRDSYLNDGIYKVVNATNTEVMVEEPLRPEHTGNSIRVVASSPPSPFVDLVSDIKGFKEDRLGIASEKIDDYSVSYSEGQSWQDVYKSKLNQYRRVYPDIFIAKRW